MQRQISPKKATTRNDSNIRQASVSSVSLNVAQLQAASLDAVRTEEVALCQTAGTLPAVSGSEVSPRAKRSLGECRDVEQILSRDHTCADVAYRSGGPKAWSRVMSVSRVVPDDMSVHSLNLSIAYAAVLLLFLMMSSDMLSACVHSCMK